MYAILFAVACGLSYLAYNSTTPPLSGRSRAALGMLRAIGLMCLLLMLFEPLIRFTRSWEERPRTAILLDVSKSMRSNSGGLVNTENARDIVRKLLSTSAIHADVFFFDGGTHEASASDIDTVNFQGYRTDLTSAIRNIANRTSEIDYRSIVIISDGNHNGDEAPVYQAERSGMAIYGIAIGDTAALKDIRAVGLITPAIAVVGQPVSLSFEFNQTKMGAGTATVVFDDNGTEFGRLEVAINPSQQRYTVHSPWTPASEGIRKVTARILPLDGELATNNNLVQEFVPVRKNKRRVVLFAGSPSPDVAFVKQALLSDPSIQVNTFVEKAPGVFYEGDPGTSAFDNVEAIVFIGFPTASSPTSVLDRCAQALARGKSLLFISSLQTDYRRLGPFKDALPFVMRSSQPQEMMVTPDVGVGSISDPIMKLSGNESDAVVWNRLPPIYRTETFVDPLPDAVVLATIRVGSAPLRDPLILRRESSNTRSVAVLGYGIYRWKLLAEGPAVSRGSEVTDVLQKLISNSITWLSLRDDGKRVRIRTSHRVYAAGEPVVVYGSVLDGSLSPVDNAEVRAEIVGVGIRKDVVLSALGGGRYTYTVGPLAPGDYVLNGLARLQALQLGVDEGRFTVTEASVEDRNEPTNVQLLTTLSLRTGAITVFPSGIDSLVDHIKTDARLQPVARSAEWELALYHLPWLVALAITCFGLEWYYRKKRGLS